MKVNRETAPHYNWKEVCDGWHLADEPPVSIIEERMPPDTREDMHCHDQARQFFYVLSGRAVLRLETGEETLEPGDGLFVQPGQWHQMVNPFPEDVRFLVFSTPMAHGDRRLRQEAPGD